MPLFKVLMKQESWQEVVVEADDHRDAMDLAENEINQDAWVVDVPYPLSAVTLEDPFPTLEEALEYGGPCGL